MNPELIYFLKINVGIALFYAFYRLFFYKDTFFHWRRIALLGFFILSLVYPLMNLQEWVKEQEPIVAMVDLYADMVLPEYSGVTTPVTDWNGIILSSIAYLYGSGVALLLLRFLIQLASIIRLRINCRATDIQGVRVYVLKQEGGPFSFFQWIFIHPEAHTVKEIGEIFTHELTHARQYHSVDVIFSEMMCIVCWFNPFAWLMKREVRNNLEYMADNRVIQTGHDYQSYQFHLLGLAHQKAAANLSNSFNVLPLKNRIKMMNKKRTKEIGRTKYLMFLPLAALLMIISNIEAVARTTKSIAKEVMQTVEQVVDQAPAIVSNIQQTPPQDKKKVAQGNKKKAETDKSNKKPPVFEVVDEAPQYPGGTTALMEFLKTNVRYPEAAHKAGTQGRVIVQFVVEKDGSVSETHIAKGVSPELDKEAIRVISAMPAWIPGKQRGEPQRVKFTVPVMFRLSDPKAEEIKDSRLSEVVVKGYEGEEGVNSAPVIFEVVEQMPKYPGGVNGMMQYLARTIKYPVVAQESKTEGQVIVQMVVNKEGQVTNTKVIKSVSPELDAEAIRVVSGMPRWEPGMQRGQAVNVRYTLPIAFRLEKPQHKPTPVKAN